MEARERTAVVKGCSLKGFVMGKKKYLKVGDEVIHCFYSSWGIGVVVEEKNSTVPGGMCIVRIVFQDGKERTFINDLEHSCCCYYTGIKHYNGNSRISKLFEYI